MALLVGTGRGARSGIVIRGTDVLESTRRVTTIVLDKTGTLTTGRPSVVAIAGEIDDDTILSDAARVEVGTDHPLARAIVAEATSRGVLGETATGVIAEPGKGAVGQLGTTVVRVGSLDWMRAENIATPEQLMATAARWGEQGRSVIAVAHGARVVGVIAVSDVVKPSAIEAVAALRRLGIRPIMASGDSDAVANLVAREVGIDEVHAGVSPADKRALIAGLQERGAVVAMVGDGINDAAALAQADLGIAMGHGTDVAIESSDIIVVSTDLRHVADAIRLSRATLGTIRGNLLWAFGYNVLAIPVALAGLLGPALAGLAMAFSSVFVVLNSARLSALRLTR
jgi:Cu+-exporting ATPase